MLAAVIQVVGHSSSSCRLQQPSEAWDLTALERLFSTQ